MSDEVTGLRVLEDLYVLYWGRRVILTVLMRPEKPFYQLELADEFGVSSAYLARVVKRLEECGWVERYYDPANLLKRYIRLTPKTYNVLQKLGGLSDE